MSSATQLKASLGYSMSEPKTKFINKQVEEKVGMFILCTFHRSSEFTIKLNANLQLTVKLKMITLEGM